MRLLPVAALALTLAAVGCSSDDAAPPKGDCPVTPLDVVVTVGAWSDPTAKLAGDCARVTTIAGSRSDPHEFEPSPADLEALRTADLVVVNGLGYDSWADDAVAALDAAPPVVDAGEVVGLADGANPHIWYSAEYVFAVGTQVTSQLSNLAPEAAEYLAQRSVGWTEQLNRYRAELAKVADAHPAATYAATEPVADLLATAAGLTDATPTGYRDAALNETEPSPADLAAFVTLIESGNLGVLVVNTQTEGPSVDRLREAAEQSDVAIVEVTEAPPSGTGFVAWQLAQIEALSDALSK